MILALIGLLLLLLGLSYLGFYMSCVAARDAAPEDAQVLQRTSFLPYADQLRAGWDWIEQQATQTFTIQSFDGLPLTAQYISVPNSQGTVVCVHGYRSSYRVDFSCTPGFYAGLGLNLLLINQRAHRGSGGRYITYGVKERQDVRSWVLYLNERFGDHEPLFLSGLSMGAATVQMACALDLPKNVRGVISDCGFTSAYEIVKKVAREHGLPWWCAGPMLALYCRVFAGFRLKECSTVEIQQKNDIPTLFIHGTGDKFVPWEMTAASYEACRAEGKELLLIDGAGHGVSYFVDMPGYQKAVARFVENLLSEKNPEAQAEKRRI